MKSRARTRNVFTQKAVESLVWQVGFRSSRPEHSHLLVSACYLVHSKVPRFHSVHTSLQFSTGGVLGDKDGKPVLGVSRSTCSGVEACGCRKLGVAVQNCAFKHPSSSHPVTITACQDYCRVGTGLHCYTVIFSPE